MKKILLYSILMVLSYMNLSSYAKSYAKAIDVSNEDIRIGNITRNILIKKYRSIEAYKKNPFNPQFDNILRKNFKNIVTARTYIDNREEILVIKFTKTNEITKKEYFLYAFYNCDVADTSLYLKPFKIISKKHPYFKNHRNNKEEFENELIDKIIDLISNK